MGSGGHVLLVDAEPGMQAVIGSICEEFGKELLFSDNARKALRLVKKTPPKLIILDLSLNGDMNGAQLISRLRRQAETRETPILILTRKNTLPDRATAMENGGNDYLVKPFSIELLREKVKKLSVAQR
jgi:DNA-binding response OmpR family regulator